MKKHSKVIAVVVTYNRRKLLAECLHALLQQNHAQADILVVDNASTDGTDELMNRLIGKTDRIGYLRLQENIGGAGGFYRGMKCAIQAGYEHIWLMDDDTIVTSTALEELLQAAHKIQHSTGRSYGYLSSRAVWTDGSLCKMNRQHLRGEAFYQNHMLLEEGILPIRSASFVSLLVHREAVLAQGLPFREYFIWGDDKEYTLRIARKFPCYVVNRSVVVHKMQSNNGSDIIHDEVSRIDRYRYAFRNDYATARIEGKTEVFRYFVIFARTVIRIIKSNSSHKGKRIYTMMRGMFAGLHFYPQVTYASDVKGEKTT